MLYNLFNLADGTNNTLDITNYFNSNVKNVKTDDDNIIIEFSDDANLTIKIMLGGYCMDMVKATEEINKVNNIAITKAILSFKDMDDSDELSDTEMYLNLYSGMELVCSIRVYIAIDVDTDMFVLAVDDGTETYKNLYEVCWC